MSQDVKDDPRASRHLMRSKVFSLRSIWSIIFGVFGKTVLMLTVLVYSLFLAEIIFHVVVLLSVPLTILHDHMFPASLIFLDALSPATEVFWNDVLGAILLFLGSLLLPLTAGGFLHFFLFPTYVKLLKLAW